ncbi:MAG: Rieske 2Fe-2S domain-containing protein [Candidatus Heimdallarchaeota archaeon]|nr:Rieske 2Fe-2S domain-containing protein [Candidatus Heimdallarchaeota archaeon]
MSDLVFVCDISSIKEGILNSVDVEGIPLMVSINEGKYLVNSRICTHKTYDLTKGHFSPGYVTCLLHTSVFDLEDGEAQNPPATEALEIYQTQIKDSKLYIVL